MRRPAGREPQPVLNVGGMCRNTPEQHNTMTVLNCVATGHDRWLVLLAAVACVAGRAVTLGLYQRVPEGGFAIAAAPWRAMPALGGRRSGWRSSP